VRWTRSAATTASAPPLAAGTSRLRVIRSSSPSSLRSIDSSSGRLAAVATSVTALRTTAGASALVAHAASCSTYARSSSVSPPSRENESVAELVDVEPGNAASSAWRAWTAGALAGRNFD
jgi:hypothetical protein